MDHSCAQHFDPSSALTHRTPALVAEHTVDVDAYAWLDFRIILAAKARFPCLPEKLTDKGIQGSFQLGHADIRTDRQPLILIKHDVVAGIGFFVAVDFARNDKAVGWFGRG